MFLFVLEIFISWKVTVNGGVIRGRLTFEFDYFDFVKATTKKTGN